MSYRHPRRTTKTTSTALTPSLVDTSSPSSLKTNMSLRKGATFHHPSSPDQDTPSPFTIPSLPRRSETTLEDVVDAHTRRIALTLGDIDRTLTATEGSSSTIRQAFPDEADPVPQSFLDHTVGNGPYGPIMDAVTKDPAARRVLRPRNNRRSTKYADSGLGSSIATPTVKEESVETTLSDVKTTGTASAITRSVAARSSTEIQPRLSSRASNRIREHILKPLLAKPSLKDFHPIVRDCPRRIHNREIVCLRDLEKTLMFMAPERTKTAALYLEFCITSIRCIQATVEYLNETDQKRPSDRPYTNGYFVDLVDQIKQYAQQIQAAKEKAENGEELGELDAEASDEVRLHGGLTKNGRPAELVRVKKNGKAISIATGLPVDMDEDTKNPLFKRSLSEEAEDDESILRSMARRKRSASAAELAPKRCREPGCTKEFKRPCDLTKHEKTHSRPWKCPVETCKYHEYGWPTEKEMDRHHNDKHSAAPPQYRCHFEPCPYQSKRESNCKQHMEKAHGWEYVRSKNNGKNKGEKLNTTGLPTPQTTNIRTPSSSGDMHTPEDFAETTYNEPVAWPSNNHLNFPTYQPAQELDMFNDGQIEIDVDFSPISDLTHYTSSTEQSPYVANTMGQDHFQENFNDIANSGSDFNLFDNDDLYSANVQLPTPSPQIFTNLQGNSPFESSGMQYGVESLAHISPVGHGTAMLYTPSSLRDVDEGFEDFIPQHSNMNADFQLFPTSGQVTNPSTNALFGSLPAAVPSVASINRPDVTPRELLDFYTAQTAAAYQRGLNQGAMDWTQDGQFFGN